MITDQQIRDRARLWIVQSRPEIPVNSAPFAAMVDAYAAGFEDQRALHNGLIAERDKYLAVLNQITELIDKEG